MENIFDSRHAASPLAFAVHDAGIQLYDAFCIGYAAQPHRGVARIGLGHVNSHLYGIENGTAPFKNF